MTVDPRGNAIGAYRTRRTRLIHEAQAAEETRRTEKAKQLRAAAEILSIAISDEILDERPTGLGVFDEVEG